MKSFIAFPSSMSQVDYSVCTHTCASPCVYEPCCTLLSVASIVLFGTKPMGH